MSVPCDAAAMPDRSRRRAGSVRVLGRRRSTYLAHRLGIGLRESRVALAMTQAAASDRAGVSQGFWSALEHGRGSAASLETLAACAAAVGTQLAAFVEATPGADLPRDIAHLRGQAAILRFAAPGGWIGSPEADIDVRSRRSRAIDVRLDRRDGREIAVVELVDLLADGGDALRGLSDKVRAVRHANPPAAVRPPCPEGDGTESSAGRGAQLAAGGAVPGAVGRVDRGADAAGRAGALDRRVRVGSHRWFRAVRRSAPRRCRRSAPSLQEGVIVRILRPPVVESGLRRHPYATDIAGTDQTRRTRPSGVRDATN